MVPPSLLSLLPLLSALFPVAALGRSAPPPPAFSSPPLHSPRVSFRIVLDVRPTAAVAGTARPADGDCDGLPPCSPPPPPSAQEEEEEAIASLFRIAAGHFVSQALLAAVRLGVPDALCAGDGCAPRSADEIASDLSAADAAAPDGRGDRTSPPSLACLVEHWTERPLWDAWSAWPDHVAGTSEDPSADPFEAANGSPASEYYGAHPASLRHANDLVGFVSSREVDAILGGFDWSSLSGKTVVDVGGYHGAVMGAVKSRFPGVRCVCLDLPEVIEAAASSPPPGVELVGGDMFDPATYPRPCDVILLKHILADYDGGACARILRACRSVLPPDGRVVVGEAALPDAGEAGMSGGRRAQIYVDALMGLTGGRGERTAERWSSIAAGGGFEIESVRSRPSSPTCDVLVLAKA